MEASYPLDDNFSTGDVGITQEIKSYLYETAKWGKFISIVGFISIGFLVLGLLIFIFAGAAFFSYVGAGEAAGMGGIGLGFVIVFYGLLIACLLYTSPSPRDGLLSRMPSSA